MNAPSATLGEGLIERLRDQRISGFNAAMRVREEAADWITKLERENLELRHDMERGMTNHNADLSATLDPSRVPGCKGNPDTCMRPMCSVATPRCAVPSEKRASAPPAIFTEGTHVVRPRWIPVTEKVPSETRDQIICLAFSPTDADGDDSVPGAFVASYDDGEWCSRMDSGCWEPGDVTHWMPFPDGPALEANRQGGA